MRTRTLVMLRIISILLFTITLVACQPAASDEAGRVVEQYFQAIVAGDEDRIATLSCADWETSARADVAAFYGVKARLEEVACQPVEPGEASADGSVVVECSGVIVATYNNEDASFELAGKQFQVINQDGEWLVCGYAQ